MEPDKYKVYLLDDDADDIELLSKAFEEVGCTSDVASFTSAAALFHQLQNVSSDSFPDLIVMDHQMPLTDGSDVVKVIRHNKSWLPITLIIYSTTLQETKVQGMLLNGVDCCLIKAHNFTHMKDHVKLFCDVIVRRQRGPQI